MIEFDLHTELHGAGGRMDLAAQGTLASGEFTALFGPSGVGKTTMLRMLAGLVEPQRGFIRVDGETWFDSAAKKNLLPQRRSVGLVFQDQALFPNLTVRQNIAYALAKDQHAWLDELIGLTGLEALQERSPATLSGGQKQRVALARALARKPRLLLLDEPLSALDQVLRLQLQEELQRLHQRFGLTTLMVSHDVGEVFKLAHHVMRMEHGKIVQTGTPATVFLQRQLAGKLHLQAQVLAIRHEEVVYTLSLLIGNDIVDIIASADEVAQLRVGSMVSVAAGSFGPVFVR